MSAERKSRPVSALWALSDYFKQKAAPIWVPTAKYELRSSVEAYGTTWKVSFSVMALGEGAEPDSARIRLEADVMFWPPPLAAEAERRLVRRGWYEGVRLLFSGRGYSGGWRRDPVGVSDAGRWAMFTKALADPASARRESVWLEGLAATWKDGVDLGQR